MIVLDTNILIYARREELPSHKEALELLKTLAQGDTPWAIPWPCIYEFLRVITHPRVFDPPTELEDALNDLESLVCSPSLTILGEGSSHFTYLKRILSRSRAIGNIIHDAHIATLAIEHGAHELLSADHDFARFSDLKTRNPFQ